ncbi:MAG TPA: CrcB family protein, partial [Ilumatobacteraceae bacterium]
MTPRIERDVLAAIAVGGILGATARFEVAQALPNSPGRFPWATFWTNMTGSLALGFLLVLLLKVSRGHRLLRPFLATGVLGAFTTMSTYLVETAV